MLSTAYFIVKMGMTGIRRRYSGGEITSKRIRNSLQGRCLQENGQMTRVFEFLTHPEATAAGDSTTTRKVI